MLASGASSGHACVFAFLLPCPHVTRGHVAGTPTGIGAVLCWVFSDHSPVVGPCPEAGTDGVDTYPLVVFESLDSPAVRTVTRGLSGGACTLKWSYDAHQCSPVRTCQSLEARTMRHSKRAALVLSQARLCGLQPGLDSRRPGGAGVAKRSLVSGDPPRCWGSTRGQRRVRLFPPWATLSSCPRFEARQFVNPVM